MSRQAQHHPWNPSTRSTGAPPSLCPLHSASITLYERTESPTSDEVVEGKADIRQVSACQCHNTARTDHLPPQASGSTSTADTRDPDFMSYVKLEHASEDPLLLSHQRLDDVVKQEAHDEEKDEWDDSKPPTSWPYLDDTYYNSSQAAQSSGFDTNAPPEPTVETVLGVSRHAIAAAIKESPYDKTGYPRMDKGTSDEPKGVEEGAMRRLDEESLEAVKVNRGP